MCGCWCAWFTGATPGHRPSCVTAEPCHRAGSDGATRRKGSTGHAAVETLGTLLTVMVTPADAQDRAHVGTRAAAVQDVMGSPVEGAFVDQGIRVQVVTWPEATRGVVVLVRRWVVARRVAWMTQFRRLARNDERWPETLAGLHLLAFPVLMLHRFPLALAHSP
jgi:transposase